MFLRRKIKGVALLNCLAVIAARSRDKDKQHLDYILTFGREVDTWRSTDIKKEILTLCHILGRMYGAELDDEAWCSNNNNFRRKKVVIVSEHQHVEKNIYESIMAIHKTLHFLLNSTT